MASTKVAIVTGSNKGIGLAIVKGLCKSFNGDVFLTARSIARGEQAVKDLNAAGFQPKFHALDIDSETSVTEFAEYIRKTYGGIDLLVNNAAIAFKVDATEDSAYQAEHTVKTNYFGTLRVCTNLFPLLRENARVVNISSSAGHLSRIPSESLRAKFGKPTLTITELSNMMNEFVNDAKENKHVQNGWGQSTYVVSKVGVTALTRIQQRELDAETPKRNVSVNAVHPGYVDTDMTSHKGVLTVDEGAKAPLYLSLQAHDLKGAYVWCDNRVIDWFAATAPQN